MKTCVLLLAAVALLAAYKLKTPPPPPWGSHYTPLLEQARAENKPILLDFTGSDWCPWCIKMKQEVLDSPQFATYARQNLVLATVDFPSSLMLNPGGNAQNEDLKKQYKVQGFPAYVLVDEDGRELGRIPGYLPGGPVAFIARLNTFYTPAPAMVTYSGKNLNVVDQASPSPRPTANQRRGHNAARP